MPKPLNGPKEASAAFVRGGALTIIDGRGNIWTWDSTVTVDADGDDIEAPASFDYAEVSRSGHQILAISGSTAWTYDMNSGDWHEGLSVDERLEGEDEQTTNPWKRGHNVNTRAPMEEVSPSGKRKKKAA